MRINALVMAPDEKKIDNINPETKKYIVGWHDLLRHQPDLLLDVCGRRWLRGSAPC